MTPASVWIQLRAEGLSTVHEHVVHSLHENGWSVDAGPHPSPNSLFGVCFVSVSDGALNEDVRRWLVGSPLLRLLLVASGGRLTDRHHLLCAGVEDLLTFNSIDETVAAILLRVARWRDVETIAGETGVVHRIIGDSVRIRRLIRRTVEAARYGTGPILLTGESGTGKELFAELIHAADCRADRRSYVICDCTNLHPDLAGSELFGHERGAFTNAVDARDGAIALADRGTLFLDEVGELPLRLQAELLRVLQEGTYKRIGSNSWRRSRFRLICATNRDLKREIHLGRFRSDLYYRIASTHISVCPLAERSEDVLTLARHFAAQALDKTEAPEFDPDLADYLRCRPYRGNVRELRQLIFDVASRYAGAGALTLGLLSDEELERTEITGRSSASWEDAVRTSLDMNWSLTEIRNFAADTAYRLVLRTCRDNTEAAAEVLKVTRRAVQQFVQRNGELPGATER